MASNITNAAAFATTNLKVDPGEQGDALWAQKVADNTGHVYFREIPLPDVAPSSSTEKRYVFTKRASHNGIKALTRGLAAGAVTEYMRVFAESADETNDAAYAAVGTLAYSRANHVTQRFDLDISGLTDGNVYLLTYTRNTVTSAVQPAVWMTYGSNATY